MQTPVGWMKRIMFHGKDSLGCSGRMDWLQGDGSYVGKGMEAQTQGSHVSRKALQLKKHWGKGLSEIDMDMV